MGRGFLELCGSMCPAPLYLYTYLLRFETKILLILLNIVVYQAWFLVLTCVAFIWQSAFYLLPLRVLFGPWFYKSDWWWFYKGRGFWIFTPVGFNQTEVFTKLPVTFLFPPGLQSGREEYIKFASCLHSTSSCISKLSACRNGWWFVEQTTSADRTDCKL